MKKHNTLKVVLITILVFMLLTWILTAAYFSNGYMDQGRIQMGLFDLFNYPITAISYFGYIALFVLTVGAFYGVLGKTGAYRTLLDKVAGAFSKKKMLALSIIMILIAVLTSVCGLQIALIIFFPMLVSIILLMGYDKMVAALTLVGSTMIGVAGSTFAYTNTNIIVTVLSIDVTAEIISKIIILVLGLVLLIFNTLRYAKKIEATGKKVVKKEVKKVEVKTKDTKTKTSKTATKTKSSKDTKAAVKDDEKITVVEKQEESELAGYVPKEVKGKKHKVWPLVVIFSISLIILVLSFTSWSGAFNVTMFEDATTAVTGFKIFKFQLFGKLLGNINAFGAWTLADLITLIIIMTLLISLIYRVKFDDMIDGVVEGAKKAVLPAVIVILIYTCLVITTYHPFQLVIYKAILDLTKGFNILTSTLVAILAALFNVEPSYAFQSALPYMASIITKKSTYPLIGVIFQSIYGLTMLAAPTSVVLMCVLSYLKISYGKWFKTIWKLLLEFLVVLLIIFTVLILI